MKPEVKNIRKIPLRTCIGCRQTRPQRELIRLYINKNGELEIDLRKNKPGRGAYLCPRKECRDKGLKKDKLEYTLRTKISPEALKLFQQKDFPFVKNDIL